MPTHDPQARLTLDAARARLADVCFPETAPADPADPGVGLIGLEPELFAFRVRPDGSPGERLPLYGDGVSPGVVEVLRELVDTDPYVRVGEERRGHAPTFELADGGQLTFEPGAQIEHSTSPYRTGVAALDGTKDVFCKLQRSFRRHGIALVSTGVDPWNGAAEVPQQLDAPRYEAMAAYFEKHGPHGRTMMRLTASQQVNLDLGSGRAREDRWTAAYLAVPAAAAAFSTSPKPGWVNARAAAWQRLDPSRAGIPRLLLEGRGTPVEQYAEAALAADVMLVRRADGSAEPGTPGWSFLDWMQEGHREGWPTEDDLVYHLTTLFFEVRPRGFFEIRSTDALPAPWMTAPVVLWCGLLYDPVARGQVIDRLERFRPRLPELWRRAAKDGLNDPEVAEITAITWNTALDGARRLPNGYFTPACIAGADMFLDAFTRRLRSPADDLRGALAQGSAHALRWGIGDAGCPTAAEDALNV